MIFFNLKEGIKFKMKKRIVHNIPPFYNKDSKVLILGSLPSEISRKEKFYYANPQNRFWQVLEKIFEEKIIDKKSFLKKKKIAMWDVINSCDIESSSDASISNVVVNDLNLILQNANIKIIFVTGNTAYKYFKKFYKDLNIPAIKLPSPSSANARFSLDDLTKFYDSIRTWCEED